MALERATGSEEEGQAVTAFTESTVEEAAGWRIAHGPDISPGGDTLTLALSRRKRTSYSEVMHPARQGVSPVFE